MKVLQLNEIASVARDNDGYDDKDSSNISNQRKSNDIQHLLNVHNDSAQNDR